MNKLKVGDIVYIAKSNEIMELVHVGDFYYFFTYGRDEWISVIHEQMDLGFIIKLEL